MGADLAEIVDLAARRGTQAAELVIERAVHEVMDAIMGAPDALAVICGAARSLHEHCIDALLFAHVAQMVIDRMSAVEREADQPDQPNPAA
jgi:hypothetical protein